MGEEDFHEVRVATSVTHLDVPWRHHFRDLLFLYEQARKDPAFQELCSRPADLFFTNYTFTTPLALGGRSILQAGRGDARPHVDRVYAV